LNEIEELFPFYALGNLSEDEQAQVEAYVNKDASAKARLEEMIQSAQVLPFETTPTPPSGPVKEALMARVQADLQASRTVHEAARPARNIPHWVQILKNAFVSPAFSAFAFTAAILLLVWGIRLQQAVRDLTADNQTLQETVSELISENELLRDELLSQEEVMALLTSPTRQEVPVAGTEFQPDAYGTLLVGADQGVEAVFLVSNLPALPAGSVYQFWLIGNDGPVGAGIFQSNAQGQGVLLVRSDSPVLSFDAIGVSIEPDGGSDQPTGNIVLLGNLPQGGGS